MRAFVVVALSSLMLGCGSVGSSRDAASGAGGNRPDAASGAGGTTGGGGAGGATGTGGDTGTGGAGGQVATDIKLIRAGVAAVGPSPSGAGTTRLVRPGLRVAGGQQVCNASVCFSGGISE